jgi:hypothetical protein
MDYGCIRGTNQIRAVFKSVNGTRQSVATENSVVALFFIVLLEKTENPG